MDKYWDIPTLLFSSFLQSLIPSISFLPCFYFFSSSLLPFILSSRFFNSFFLSFPLSFNFSTSVFLSFLFFFSNFPSSLLSFLLSFGFFPSFLFFPLISFLPTAYFFPYFLLLSFLPSLQWRGTSHSPKFQHYWSFTIRLVIVISWTLIGGVLAFCRDAIGVFCNPTWVGHLQ